MDISCPHNEALFKSLGTDPTQMAVSACTVVEHFNIIEDIGAGQIASLVESLSYPLLFQTAKKRRLLEFIRCKYIPAA